MNYFDAKFFHIVFVMVFIASQSVLFIENKKLHKILAGISSLFIIATGFMLMSRFGVNHSGPFPVWIIIKIAIWFLLSIIFPIIFKRFRTITKLLFIPWLLLLFMAAAMAIYKF